MRPKPHQAPQATKKMTLREAIHLLKEAGIDSAAYDARELFVNVGGMNRSELVSTNASCDLAELTEAIKRRAAHEPLQYIIGKVGFYRETYKVTPDCLIPRSDTEILVDYAVKNLPKGAFFVDLCTGSGCIAVSTLNNTAETTAMAVDISKEALEIAKENAEYNGISNRLSFQEADVTKSVVCSSCFAVLSNPPYVTNEAYESLMPEIYFEPKIAFVGGEDGLDFYESITSLYRDVISDEGFIAFEIGYDQANALRIIANQHNMNAQILQDLSGNDRVAVLKKK